MTGKQWGQGQAVRRRPADRPGHGARAELGLESLFTFGLERLLNGPGHRCRPPGKSASDRAFTEIGRPIGSRGPPP
jgi:hypothetical protein